MPEPNENESEQDFVSRCIPAVLEDGAAEDEKQAAAICYGKWRDKDKKAAQPDSLITFGSAVKALGDGRMEGYLVLFGNSEQPDTDGEYFDAKTDFGEASRSVVYYNHGFDPKLGLKTLGAAAELGIDDIGVWFRHQLDLRERWQKAVYKLGEAGMLGLSSGTAPHLVVRERVGKATRIARWHLGLDASYTPTPADLRNVVMPLKSWTGTLALEPEADADEASGETEPEGAIKTAQRMPDNTEVRIMAENEVKNITLTADDLKNIVAGAVTEALKATEKPLTPKVGHVSDEADRAAKGNPFKSTGEYLLAVVKAARGDIDPRLLPMRSTEVDDEGGFEAEHSRLDGAVKSGWGKASGMSEGSAPSAGFLVGTDRAAGILERVYDVGSLLARIPTDTLSGDNDSMEYNAEDETSRADGYRRGGIRAYWAAEAGTVTASAPKFRKVELKLKKAMALVYATSELLKDASALEGYIMRNLPEELRFLVENSIINGTGAGMPKGILAVGPGIEIPKETGQAADTVVSANIVKMFARMWTRGLANGVWMLSQDVWPQLFQMTLAVGTGGIPVFMPPGGLSVAPYGSILGRSVLPLEYCGKIGDAGDIVFFDPTQYQMITKGGMEAASSIHVKFVYDESCFRFVWRVDGAPMWASALTPYNAGATVSPIITLAAR